LNLTYKDLTIRNAVFADAKQLVSWWNDGDIMAHAGFPNGLGIPDSKIDKVGKSFEDSDDFGRVLVIEYCGKPIGEMSYRTPEDKVAEIGIKICDANMQERGLGVTLLSMLIDALFTHYGYEKIMIDTNLNNKRTQHVYEKKLGFQFTHIAENSWTDQLGQLQSSIHYEMTKDNWINMAINKITYRRD